MLSFEDRTVELFPPKEAGAPLVVVNTLEGEGKALHGAVREMTGADFALAAVGSIDWEEDLTPWPAPSLEKGHPLRGGGADAYVDQLASCILPRVVERLEGPPAWVGLAGYSLGGLFALYAPFRTDAFARVASASGSLWYPGFVDFALSHEPLRRPDAVYLSLGDRESRTRNPMLRGVEDETRRLAAFLVEGGVPSAFELNPGGHFNDENRRLARAIAWMLEGGRRGS